MPRLGTQQKRFFFFSFSNCSVSSMRMQIEKSMKEKQQTKTNDCVEYTYFQVTMLTGA